MGGVDSKEMLEKKSFKELRMLNSSIYGTGKLYESTADG